MLSTALVWRWFGGSAGRCLEVTRDSPDLCSHVLSGTSVPTQGLQLVGATSEGESSDYRGNLPAQCVHPVGHWYEIPQFEKLWGDMTSLPEASTEFFLVPRQRGQQLKEVAHLDGWDRDGSRSFIESLCEFV
jgi:hypothetical protein